MMLNLVVEKGAGKDHEWSGSSITQPRTGTPTGFVQRSRLNFGFKTSPYIVGMCFLFVFFIIVVALTSSPCASLTLTLVVHLSIARAIYFSHLSIALSLFSNFYLNYKRNLKLSLILIDDANLSGR